jgi:hypothetical protein
MSMMEAYRMPESFNAFCSIVSFTAANTSRIFVVSVACVKLNSDITIRNAICEVVAPLTGGIHSVVPDWLA